MNRVDGGTRARQYPCVVTLKERLQFVVDRKFAGNMSSWAREAGISRMHVRKLLERDSAENGRVEALTFKKLASAAEVSPGWLAYGVGKPGDKEWMMVPDPKVGTLLIKLGETPGLKDWVTNHPEEVTISELMRGVEAYEKSPSLARASDGRPKDGWGVFFEDLRAGRIGIPTSAPGAEAAVAELERSQLEAQLQNARRFKRGKPKKSPDR